MPSAPITVRKTQSGRRYVVRFRLGGRAYPLVHAGSFRTLKAARARQALVLGELAAGRNPQGVLREMTEQPKLRSLERAFDEFIASRVDVAQSTVENYKTAKERFLPIFRSRDPLTLTWKDVQEAIGALTVDLCPASVKIYVGTLRQVLDFAGADPNPARDKRVKLPRGEIDVPEPPSEATVVAIVANAPPKWRLALQVLEQTGMRAGELAKLEWQDLDLSQSRFRIRQGKTRAARRWVAVPEWLMEDIAATCPLDDRTPERRVFPGATRQVLGMAMRRGCQAAGLPLYSPHDLRHRYASVKIREGVPVTDLAAQLGHARKSMTLDTYSHVLLQDS
jgi:integrase